MKQTLKTSGFYLALGALLSCLGLVLAEVGLRVLFHERLAHVTEPAESLFWISDDQLGWTHQPGSTGEFSNGFFRGAVHIDQHGNRENSAEGTFVPGYPTIAFIGDSTVASFEVDDGETVPAMLESRLRAQGLHYNVVNMGVRGYGTDQSVRKALMLAQRYTPTDVIYMFVDNDMYDNNVLRQPDRRFGKGVYLSASEGSPFETRNYPVPEYAANFAGLVVLDEHCVPLVHTATLSQENLRPKWSAKVTPTRSYTYRALKQLYAGFGSDDFDVYSRIDPYMAIKRAPAEWNFDFYHAYKIYGRLRVRCGRYLEAQIASLLRQLRTIPSVRRVHVVHFPAETALHALRNHGTSADSDLFARLRREGTIDSYLDLPQAILAEHVDVRELTCRRDPHFCRQGNEWITAQILSGIRFDRRAPSPVRQ